MLSIIVSAEPMETQRLMAQALGSSDPLPSRLLRRVVDEMVNTGWIAKSAYFLIPQCGGSRTLMGPPRQYVSSDSGRRSRRIRTDKVDGRIYDRGFICNADKTVP